MLIATGRAPSRLAVPGEKELVGRGVSYCAICDAAFFRGLRVAVVGPAQSAAEAALQLAALDAEVTVVCDQSQLRASSPCWPGSPPRPGWSCAGVSGDEHPG